MTLLSSVAKASRCTALVVAMATVVSPARAGEAVTYLLPAAPDQVAFAPWLVARQLGYYAMPMLWRDEMIGWVNVSARHGKPAFEAGFKKAGYSEPSFRKEFEAEAERFRLFLQAQHAVGGSPAGT